MFATVVLGSDVCHYTVSLEHEPGRSLSIPPSPLAAPNPPAHRRPPQPRPPARRLARRRRHRASFPPPPRPLITPYTRTDLGPVDRPIAGVVALAGSPNVVLLHRASHSSAMGCLRGSCRTGGRQVYVVLRERTTGEASNE